MIQSAAACAKFILGGEHSIVYKGRALCFPLKKLVLKVHEIAESKLIVNKKEVSDASYFDKIRELRRIFGVVSNDSGIEVESEIPIGGGLGSSAALCTALARLYTGRQGEELAKLALEGERLFHGKPSGIDPYTVAFEQPLVYGRDQKFRPLQTTLFKNSGYCFVIKDSGLRHNTGEIIKQVGELRDRSRNLWEEIIEALSSNVELMLKAFESFPDRLGTLMNDSHSRLQALGVSNTTLDRCVNELRELGALGAKLTGAGGGGFVLGLFKQSEAEKHGLSIAY